MVWDAVVMAGLVMTRVCVFSFTGLLQGYSRIWTKEAAGRFVEDFLQLQN